MAYLVGMYFFHSAPSSIHFLVIFPHWRHIHTSIQDTHKYSEFKNLQHTELLYIFKNVFTKGSSLISVNFTAFSKYAYKKFEIRIQEQLKIEYGALTSFF